MKSIDKLNNAVAKQGGKIAKSSVGQKVMNSKVGKGVAGAINDVSSKSKAIGDLTGYNKQEAFKAYDHLVDKSINQATKNPTFVANRNMVNESYGQLSAARDKAIKDNRSIRNTRNKMKSYDDIENLTPAQKKRKEKAISKYDKKMNKATNKEMQAYQGAKDQFKATDEFKTYQKLESDRQDAAIAWHKATRDTRNARRALTGGVMVGGAGATGMAAHRNNERQKQEELNQARSSYYY